jgi:hypothetical protein
MIPRLVCPSVCIIDDEKKDYQPILEALRRLGVSCVHDRGTSGTKTRRKLKGIRLIFTDLHLGGQVGKAAASHTANIFKALIPSDTAPLLVVIWSKYAADPAGDAGTPVEDQPTEAELFKQELLAAVPEFKERLVFCQMKKPKAQYRPKGKKWVTKLKRDIREEVEKVAAFDVLWAWESFVREAGMKLTENLTALALQPDPATATAAQPTMSLHDRLKLALRVLVREQGGPDCSPSTAPRQLASVLAQTLADHLEHWDALSAVSKHGAWLSDSKGLPATTTIAPGINGLLLTAGPSKRGLPFIPGTVYRLTDVNKFKDTFGVPAGEIINICYRKLDNGTGWTRDQWKAQAKPVMIEISPACDVHQGTRRQALLLAGLILPSSARPNAKRDGAFDTLPDVSIRWPAADFVAQDAFLMFCSRYKATLTPKKEPRWLKPWFRLRDLPTASLRNWYASNAARVGYVSLRAS